MMIKVVDDDEVGEACSEEVDCEGERESPKEETSCFVSSGTSVEAEGSECCCKSCEEVEGGVNLSSGNSCSCGSIFPPGVVTTTSAQIEWYGEFGWKNIPDFLSSPQFLSLAISKSNLLLATS